MRQWTDAAAAVLAMQAYSPFGVPRTALGPVPWGFTGEWHDPGGLVYLRARWYHPAWGRFTQVDPWPGKLAAPATRHPYVYALNNALIYSDASGRFPWVILGVAAIGGAIAYGSQVYRNVQAGMEFRAALTTNIDVKPILASAGAFGLGAMLAPALIGMASEAALGVGLLTGSTAAWGGGMWGMGAAGATAATVYGLRSCRPQSDPFAGAGAAVRRGVETLRRQIASQRNLAIGRWGAQAHLSRAEYYQRQGLLNWVNPVGRNTIDLGLISNTHVEVKYWQAGTVERDVRILADQLQRFNTVHPSEKLVVEFVETARNAVSPETIEWLARELARREVDLSNISFRIVPGSGVP